MESIAVSSNIKNNKKFIPTSVVLTTLLIILILCMILSFLIGRYSISSDEFWNILLHKLFGTEALYNSSAETVMFKVRLPRVLAAVIVGAALSAAGATYQGLFRNPMVSPDLLGASSGAGFGAVLALMLNLSSFLVQVSSFAIGMLAVAVTFLISSIVSKGSMSTLSLVLTGMVVSSLFSSFISIIKYVADPNSKLPAITFWLMGGLTSAKNEDLLFLVLPVVLGLIPLLILRYMLNVLSFGDDEAKSMGINAKNIRIIMIVCSTLMTSASVAAAGMIGWVGLIIPHLARMIAGPNYKTLLPCSVLLGAIYMLCIDNVSRVLFPVEIPLGILSSLFGAPFFIYLLIKGKKGWI